MTTSNWKRWLSFLLSLCLVLTGLTVAAPKMEAQAAEYVTTASRGFNVPSTWNEGDEKITLPEAPQGWEIQLFGSDRKQVVALDGTVTRPLSDVTVHLLYQLTNKTSKEVIETNVNTSVNISAAPMEGFAAGGNEQPQVLPSLREWKGGSGEITLSGQSRILVDASSYVEADAVHRKDNISKTGNFYLQVNSFQADLKEITGLDLPIVTDGTPQAGDICFTSKDAPETLGDQGYIIEFGGSKADGDYVTVKAVHKTGILYGGISILQILTQTGKTLPKGVTRDYPEFEKRGYMLDAARTFLPVSYLEDTMKQMAWYKMNNFSLHLSDNDIWGNLTQGRDVYAAFRLESNVAGLTSSDGYYSKDEFRELQYDGMDLGINVIPELDTPGHALAYTRVWPDLARDSSGKYLDVENPETIKRVKALFEEYIVPADGKEEVFVGADVNIGTDEYKNGNKEAFRAYVNGLLSHVKSLGKNPVFWGSLLENGGDTEVMTDALMFAWYQGYADPKKSLDDGYDILSMEDSETYIVPGGGYYNNQYGRAEYLYKSWLPNDNEGWKSQSQGWAKSPAPLGHPRAVGGQFAVWNDWVGNGISTNDISFRIQYNLMSIAQKCWSAAESKASYNDFKALGDALGDAPNCDFLYRNQNFPEDKVLDLGSYDDIASQSSISGQPVQVEKSEEGMFGEGIRFNGGESYIETDVTSTGFDWTMAMWIKPDKGNGEETVLMEGKTGTLKLKQGATGKLGYSVNKLFDENKNATVDKFNHYFDYQVPTEKWSHVALTGDAYGVKLYVNGVFVDELRDKKWPNYNPNSGQNSISGIPPYYETLMLPTAVIGSKTNAFAGVVDDLKIYDRVLNANEIVQAARIPIQASENLALGKNVTTSGNELTDKWLATSVVDGGKTGDSRWSSNTADDAWLTVDLRKVETVANIDIYWEAAYAIQYKMLLSENGTDWTEVFSETKGEGGSPRSITFDPQSARYVKFQGVERKPIGGTKYGFSMYEIEVFGEKDRRAELAEKINAVNALVESGAYNSDPVVLESVNQIVASAMETLVNTSADAAEVVEMINALQAIIDGAPEEPNANLMNGAQASTTVECHPNYGPENMVDQDDSLDSRMATKKGVTEIPAEFTLPKIRTFNQLVIKEGLGSIPDETLTEQIKGYEVQIEKDGAYQTVLSAQRTDGGTVGELLTIDFGQEITASKLKVIFKADAAAGINVTEAELYLAAAPEKGSNASARDVVCQLAVDSAIESTVDVFQMPEVPAGYQVSILASDQPDVISVDGAVVHADDSQEVTLLMEVAKMNGDSAAERSVMPYKIVVNGKNEQPPVNHTVTFDANGGTVGESTRSVEEGAVIGELPIPVKGEDTFLGWYDQKEGGNQVTATTTVSEDVTLYARWKAAEPPVPVYYTVTFDANGGTVSEASRSVEEGTVIGELPVPVKGDDAFLGWYDQKEGGNQVTATTTVSEDVTLYARWKAAEPPVPVYYTVTFDGNGGTVSEASRKVSGTAIGKLPVPVKGTDAFLGWYTQREGGEQVTETTVVNRNMTLYAQWKAAEQPKLQFNSSSYRLYATQSSKTSVSANAAAGNVVSYRSSNTKVASISKDGGLTGIKAGTATIYVTTDKNITASAKVTVRKPSVTLTAKNIPLQVKKSTKVVKVKKKLATDRVVSYKSSKSKVASVSRSGLIRAKKTGTAKITVTMKSGATASCIVKVQKGKVRTKKLTAPRKVSLKSRQKKTLQVTRNPITATERISFRSSNSKIASVNKKGVVTAKKKGSCKIYVTCNKKTKRISVTIR